MSFNTKNPYMATKLSSSPEIPIIGTRGIFPQNNGWYDIDDNGTTRRFLTEDDIVTTQAELDSHKKAEIIDHPDGSVTTEKIANGAISSKKIADGAVTDAKFDGILSILKGGTGASNTDEALNNLNALKKEYLTYDEIDKKFLPIAFYYCRNSDNAAYEKAPSEYALIITLNDEPSETWQLAITYDGNIWRRIITLGENIILTDWYRVTNDPEMVSRSLLQLGVRIDFIIPEININYEAKESDTSASILDSLIKIYNEQGEELEITKENCLNNYSPKLFKVTITATNYEHKSYVGYLKQTLICLPDTLYLSLYQEFSYQNTEYVRLIRLTKPDSETPYIGGWKDKYKNFEVLGHKVDTIDDNTTDSVYYPSTKAVAAHIDTKTNEIKQKSIPHTTVSDYPVSVSDHLEGESVIDYKVYGNSVQDGTPSADNPIEIQSVGNLVTDETSEYYGKYDVPITVCGKNLMPYPYYETTRTVGGVTFTDNGDGTITVNGTATNSAYFKLQNTSWNNQLPLEAGTYTLSGCPSGGSGSTYKIVCGGRTSEDASRKQYIENTGTAISKTLKTGRYDFIIAVYAGTTLSNVVFKPQLELGSTATSYEPYNSETKHIYLDEPLRKVGDYADYIDYKNQKVVRCVDVLDDTGTKNISESYVALATPTEEAITAPDFDTSNSEVMNVSSGTVISPSSMDVTYYQDINKVITELKNAILAQGGNV